MKELESGLEKMLNIFLIKEFPDISEVRVRESNRESNHMIGDIIFYHIYVGIKYNDLLKTNPTHILVRARELSKYVLGVNEILENVQFFDPE